ncbi:relaxase/mobilization nuclease domain-containing protein [Echinicola sp. 20G]|uniref:relaxase/mobilization nuclease domain-containing protein n=1 Tax=Echinicola sp. 20G TaxID=2781961 RepID=UPI00190FFDB0|nr:relaxase/mobilization nuclease domain-containing protein [Echinicola sp. 20G]
MVVRITTGKSIKGVLHYNENKVGQGQAKLLFASGFLENNPSFQFKINRFHELSQLNRRTKTNAVHISLNFSPDDQLDRDMMEQIANEYMERIGFGNQPFLVYQHFDAGHPHLHVVTGNIDHKGKRIETHNIGRTLSETARKAIEKEYGLVVAEEQKQRKRFLLQPLEKIDYGDKETKASVNKVVDEVTSNFLFISLAQMNAVLRLFHVTAYRGEPESRMYEKKGLVFFVSDANGKRLGVPIKSSSLYGKPTLPHLEKIFARNREKIKSFKDPMKDLVSRTLDKSGSLKEFKNCLGTEGVELVIRENEQGVVYGLTYIDMINRCVFNGSQLGKTFSANAVQEYLKTKSNRISRLEKMEVPLAVNGVAKHQDQEIGDLLELLFAENTNDPIPFALRQKKKRRKLKQKMR